MHKAFIYTSDIRQPNQGGTINWTITYRCLKIQKCKLKRSLSCERSIFPCSESCVCCKPCDLYLFSYKPEAFIWSVALVRLAQDGVKGFTSCSMVAGCVCRYCKCSNIHLHRKSERMNYICNMGVLEVLARLSTLLHISTVCCIFYSM